MIRPLTSHKHRVFVSLDRDGNRQDSKGSRKYISTRNNFMYIIFAASLALHYISSGKVRYLNEQVQDLESLLKETSQQYLTLKGTTEVHLEENRRLSAVVEEEQRQRNHCEQKAKEMKDSHNEQVSSWLEQEHALLSRIKTLELQYAAMFGNEEEIEAYYKDEIFRMKEESENQEIEKAALRQTLEALESALEEQRKEIASFRVENDELRLEKEALRDRHDTLMKEKNAPAKHASLFLMWRKVCDMLDGVTSSNISAIMKKLQGQFDAAKEIQHQVAEELSMRCNTLLVYIRGVTHSLQAYARTEWSKHGPSFLLKTVAQQDIRDYFTNHCKNISSQLHQISFPNRVGGCLLKLHIALVSGIEWIAIYLDGVCTSKIQLDSCKSLSKIFSKAQENSGLVTVFLELVLGLLVLEFTVATLRKWRRKGTRDPTVRTFKKYRQQPVVSPAFMRGGGSSSKSLLRTAGGLSIRQQPDEFSAHTSDFFDCE